jgi:hypothetical protein
MASAMWLFLIIGGMSHPRKKFTANFWIIIPPPAMGMRGFRSDPVEEELTVHGVKGGISDVSISGNRKAAGRGLHA